MLQLLEKKIKFDNLDNYYQDYLNDSLYVNHDSKQIGLAEIINSFSKEEIDYLQEELNDIKEYALYKSRVHGLYHSEKVLFWAFVLGIDNHLSDIDKKILVDASKYHDIGRTNDIDDTMHGKVSASKILSYLDSDIYQQEENRNLLCAIVELHSLDDKEESSIIEKYHLDGNTRFPILWKILKDADALDRIRYDLGYLDEFSFNPFYLRMPSSPNYVKASYELCTYYKNVKLQDTK